MHFHDMPQEIQFMPVNVHIRMTIVSISICRIVLLHTGSIREKHISRRSVFSSYAFKRTESRERESSNIWTKKNRSRYK